MKRITSMRKILIVLCMLFSTAVYAYNFSAVAPSGQTLYYNITSTSSELTVQVTYPGHYSWIGYDSQIGSLTIPSSVSYGGDTYSVTSIGDYAFMTCSGLTSVDIPNSVTIIGFSAFRECSSLTSVTIPSSVTSIGQAAIYDCSELMSLFVESSNPYYDSRNNCNAIIETSTNSLLFGCKNTIIPNSVTSIGQAAFYGCSGLTSITIPDAVTSIESIAFANCSGLTSVTIPSSVTSIGGAAFSNCSALSSVFIPNSVTNIGENAFYGCSEIMNMTIPGSVTSIGNGAFSGIRIVFYCGSATGSPWGAFRVRCSYVDEDYIYEDSAKTILIEYIGSSRNITIPNTVTTIRSSAFQAYRALTSLTIPNSVTSIESRAFFGCSGLTNLRIPNSVTDIGDYAFSGCRNLDSLYLGSGLSTIGEHAFDDNNLSWLHYNAKNAHGIHSNSWPHTNYTNDQSWFSSITELIIGDSVTNIPGYIFRKCQQIHNLVIPDNVETIGEKAFYDCTNIDSLYIGSGLSTIGENAFSYGINFSWLHYNAKNAHASNGNDWPHTNSSGDQSWFSSITELIIGDSVEHIPGHIFKQCQQIHKLVIPDNVETIGEQAFYGCTNIDSLYIGSGLKSVANYAFSSVNVSFLYYNAKHLNGRLTGLNTHQNINELILGDSVQIIPEQMFQSQNRLKQLYVPNSVEAIGSYAFYNCDSLEYISIGSSVSQIGSQAFGRYLNHESNIKKLTIEGAQTLHMDSTSFENCRIDTLEH